MERLRIWEVDRTLLHTVLLLAFDTQELLNTCSSAGLPITPSPLQPLSQAALTAVREACVQDSPLARLTERRLDLVLGRHPHDTTPNVELLIQLLGTDLHEITDLPAALWSVATMHEARDDRSVRNLLARLSHSALEALCSHHVRERPA